MGEAAVDPRNCGRNTSSPLLGDEHFHQGADEKVFLTSHVMNPLSCSNPKSAQVELMKWKHSVRRLRALGCQLPDITILYRGMHSIFSTVFDRAETLLHTKWVNLQIELGLPRMITETIFTAVEQFADVELANLILFHRIGWLRITPLFYGRRLFDFSQKHVLN